MSQVEQAGDVDDVGVFTYVTVGGARHVVLADGQTRRPDVLMAATGYRRALEGPVGHLGALETIGRPAKRGRGPLLDLYFAGYELPLTGQLSEIARTARAIARQHVERPTSAGWPRGATQPLRCSKPAPTDRAATRT